MEKTDNTDLYQDSQFYFNEEYISPKRFLSFYEQLNIIAPLEVKTVLEIGIGNGIFQYLAKQLEKDVVTFDHNEKLNPDYLGSILDPLPLEDNKFDLVVAFEVFEHVPLKFLPNILNELSRITKEYVAFSVPDRNWYMKFSLSSNYFSLNRVVSIPRLLKVWKTVDELDPLRDMHYWHIGDKGVSQKSIKTICRDVGLEIVKEFRSHYNPNHHFFLLRC